MAPDPQHHLLPPYDSDPPTPLNPPRSWNPLGRSSPDQAAYHPTADDDFNDISRDAGLGISHLSGSEESIPAHKRKLSEDSINGPSANTTPGLLNPSPNLHSSQHLLKDGGVKCPTQSNIFHRRFSWVPITILVLAIYATIFAGIYLVIALLKPRWGKHVGGDGGLAPSTANLLSALFAKTIELSYVTVCVAFLGQVLSRRALTQGSQGITISDMSMRAWIMQPGSLIVHWETLRYSGLTFLGAITLTATLVAMLYTTAAEALVSPKLLMGPLEETVVWGKVSTSFGNTDWISAHCKTPVTVAADPVNRNLTCLEIEHVGHAYHNYQQWIQTWADKVAGGNVTSDQLEFRPQPTGSIYDNTTVTGSWIEIDDMTELSSKHGRMVNNITMAMPHGGVLGASIDPRNGIKQPQEASGQGKYNIDASVISPAVNVLCVGMTKEELSPLIYTEWPDSQKFSPTNWSVSPPSDIPRYPSWLNRTVVDDLFEFGEKNGQRPPIFGKYPKPYNTITNTTGYWPANAIYILGAAPSADTNPPYVLCSLRAKQTGVCSTRYEAASSGANLYTNCENSTNPLQYNHRVKDTPEGIWEADWKNIASEWANSVSLGSGITDGQAANARLLMQMLPTYNKDDNTYSLSTSLPSISEALAVMCGSTLILSTQNAPFVPYWNYSKDRVLDEPVYQSFPSMLQAVGYASGGTERWQGVFYPILVFAFITSGIVLVFMIVEVRGKQITDFTEPQNLFALAVNSPATSRLQGACGGGPVGKQLNERWFVGMEEDDEHYYIRAKAEEHLPSTPYLGHGQEIEMQSVPIKPVSPAVDEFRRVSKRGSFLAKFY
ncbi:hypothetical protein ASPWEDRAFT_168024 [Aspergillus wentii DTO 134E9]|uniref:Uncharacterized protein n=1 Tax=Aspergillus wentii DTO 134E9 TaxID=1073089 RepID=A0A1L9RT07_ASPWE|nr:uncharacterized protein ASPWEDRAFT_168024 [Aspergillus wentii DTO 134E9]KAI9933750.1 hypothetical protein MW887_004822 [Aspergillus wentii]OJJ38091.1 hypothetical protein ASPWEDRAFT_168024 [Aspergillus wentii DTO 134E9]